MAQNQSYKKLDDAGIGLVWIIAAILTAMFFSLQLTGKYELSSKVMIVIYSCMICIVTTLFGITYCKAKVSVRRNGQMGNDTVANNALSVAKREFRLIITFISMYAVFLLGVIPVLLTPITYMLDYLVGSIFAYAAITLFVMSSTISPMFTLKLRTDFRVTTCNCNNDRVSSLGMLRQSSPARSVPSSEAQKAMTSL